jgi:penicillin-binding protein 1A
MDTMPPYYSMVLGAGDTTPLRLTTAYAMLVNGGKKITPSLIDSVEDREGQTIFRHDQRACPHCGDFDWNPELADTREQVLDPGTAYQMVNILEGVVRRGTAAAAVGAKLKMPLAGKTGTTNNANEAWFVGFTPDLVAGIYVGFDQPRTLGPHEQGASVSAPIFAAFMADALKDKPPVDFRIPPGIRLVRVNATTGRLAEPGERNVIWEAFKPGTEPGDEVIEGAAGIETISGETDATTSDFGPGVLVPPGQAATAVAAPKPVPAATPSTGTGGLY